MLVGPSMLAASMGKHDACASVRGSIGDDPCNWEVVGELIAFMAGKMEAARLLIDMRDPQDVAARVTFCEASGKKLAGGVQAVELQRKFGTLVAHP